MTCVPRFRPSRRSFRLPPFDAEFKYRRKYSTCLTSVDPSIRHLSFSTPPVEQRASEQEREGEKVPLVEEEDEQKGRQRETKKVIHAIHRSESLLNFNVRNGIFFVSCYSRLIFLFYVSMKRMITFLRQKSNAPLKNFKNVILNIFSSLIIITPFVVCFNE